ncbi:MAG TPA: DUF4286 family protein [Gemmatimonadales bacterium]|jgi:Domain of unknown function (DUF4286)|nr:DUF4286 family protein [Gemmatimonadales bacterium]
MILYEVLLEVEPGLAAEVEEHMRRIHIPAILATGCFQRIRFLQAAAGRFRTSYETRSQGELDRYLRDHAPELRSTFSALFPAGVALSREVWVEREAWDQVLS